MKTTASNLTVLTALDRVNKEHGYNLEFKRFEIKGKYVHFTIKSRSGIAGARTSATGRNLAAASWHAHGYLFEEILKIEPEAVIYSLDRKIDIDGGNWEDMNVGSMMQPCMMSETSIH